MKYVILKNSHNVLSVQLPSGFGSRLEIVCFENQEELEDYLINNKLKICSISFPLSGNTCEDHSPNPHLCNDGLFIKQKEYFKKINFSDILWVEASRSYSYIHTKDNQRIIVTYPLSEVKKKLPPKLFIQCHRSFLLNVNSVDKFIGNMLYIGKEHFSISRKYKSDVLDRFIFLDNIKNTLRKDCEPLEYEKDTEGKLSNDDDE